MVDLKEDVNTSLIWWGTKKKKKNWLLQTTKTLFEVDVKESNFVWYYFESDGSCHWEK